MIIRSIKLTVCSIVLLGATPVIAAGPSTAPATPARLEAKDVLAISSKMKLVELTLVRLEALGGLLERATDAKSARDLRGSIERTFFEAEMIGVRMTMMGRPTAEDRVRVAHTEGRFFRAKGAIEKQIARILADEEMAETLKTVVRPLNEQLNGFSSARMRSMISQLQALRSQIELYKLQHRDEMPDFRKHGWSQLTERTDAQGKVGVGQYGPYLQSPPLNPFTGAAKILLVKSKPKDGFRYDQGDAGYVLEETTGRIWGLDPQGRIVDEQAATLSSVD